MSHKVCRASVTARGSRYIHSLVLPDGFDVSLAFVVSVSLAFVVYHMSSTKDQRVSSLLTSE